MDISIFLMNPDIEKCPSDDIKRRIINASKILAIIENGYEFILRQWMSIRIYEQPTPLEYDCATNY